MHILIIEDEIEIAEGIKTILDANGYQSTIIQDGRKGLDEILSGIYDLALVDIMLPGMNGLEILSESRKNRIEIPMIVLTALSQVRDKVSGLDCGADDYLTKPFDADELLARIRARLRKQNEIITDKYSINGIRLNPETQTLYNNGKSIKLARKEYLLMECLILNHKQIIPRDTLIVKVWGYEEETEYNQLEVYISFLRKKLKFIESPVTIVTVKGVGYYLEV